MSTILLEALNSGAKFLKEKGIGNPRSSAEVLLCSILNLSRVDLYLNKDQVLNERDKRKFDEFSKERASGKPLQYITGTTEFLDLEFKVDPRAMIPRPETEILTQSVIEHFKKIKEESHPLKIIDLGTGSGVIAITLAVNLKESLIYATDISEDALKLASDNATKHKVEERIEFILGDLFKPLESKNIQNSVDCIVSNPPYVKDDDSESLSKEIIDFEPEVALFSGDDGLNFHKRILKESLKYLRKDGLLALEAGWEDGDRLADLVRSEGFFHEIEIIKDLAGIKRIVKALKI
jgi:release factor glutamine methyltransferase